MSELSPPNTPSSVSSDDIIFIKYLPKDKLLYELWKNAKPAQYMYYCKALAPTVTESEVKRDINNMLRNNRGIELTTYNGRLIFSDITEDYFDPFTYNMYNGKKMAEKIINNLKTEELKRTVLNHFKRF